MEAEDTVGQRTPLHDRHAEAGARIVDFGGWDMPLVYSSIQEEHVATRTAAGLYDVSHMGRIVFEGAEAERFLDRLLTHHVASLKPGQIRYSLILNEHAGILDDVLVYRLAGRHLLVVNASNRPRILDWLDKHRSGFEVDVRDETVQTSMIAIQGPKAIELAARFLTSPPAALAYYTSMETSFNGHEVLVSRTGYTGEDGIEIIGPPDTVTEAWDRLFAEGSAIGARRAGLGARDTLRLEAGMPLYGHELTEEIDPIQAGLGWAVKGNVKDFLGKEALARRPESRPVRVGLILEGRRIAREHFDVYHADERVGWITSGTFSPTLERSIAMAYVPPSLSDAGQELSVDIRGAKTPARVAPLPFYRRTKQAGGKP